TSDPGAAGHRYGGTFSFALSRLRNLDHLLSEVGAKWRKPKNNHAKRGGARLWKSRSVEKSTKRTFPLRLEIRTQRGFPLYAQPQLLLDNKNARPRQKGTFLMSVDIGHDSALTRPRRRSRLSWSIPVSFFWPRARVIATAARPLASRLLRRES